MSDGKMIEDIEFICSGCGRTIVLVEDVGNDRLCPECRANKRR